MKKLTHSEYFTALKYIKRNDKLAFEFLKDINVFDENSNYHGEFFIDSNNLYISDDSKVNSYLFVAEVN